MPSGSFQLPADKGVFYHGTSKHSARNILRHGFRDWSWTKNSPRLGHLRRCGQDRYKHGGALGHGTYITRNWKAGLHFGPVLFRVELQPGTRILDLDIPPDPKTLNRLKRKFSHEILTRDPLEILPRNKRLTLEEAICLARHHFDVLQSTPIFSDAFTLYRARLMALRTVLIRYGIHGWGESTDLFGIAIFEASRLKPREIVVSLPTRRLAEACNDPDRTDGPHASLEAMIQTVEAITGRFKTRGGALQAPSPKSNPHHRSIPQNNPTP